MVEERWGYRHSNPLGHTGARSPLLHIQPVSTPQVLRTLTEPDERDCENQLVLLLDYDKFELIKHLLRHRWKIAVCTRLAQAQSETERASMLEEMAMVPQAVEVRAREMEGGGAWVGWLL